MLRKIYILSLIISVLMLISCNRDNDITERHLSDGAISFSPTIVEADWSAVGSKKKTSNTKGAFSANIPSIGVMAFWSTSNFEEIISPGILPNLMYNEKLTWNTSSWATSTTFYWPMGDNKSSFFAYAPYADVTNGITVSEESTSGVPIVSYKMPVDVANQPDLLIADSLLNIAYNGSPNSVHLKFERALAAIGFKIKGTGSEIITGIGINNIVDTGSINMADLATNYWSIGDVNDAQLFSVGLIKESITATETPISVMAEGGYLMVIPQAYSSDSKVVVTINDQKHSISLPLLGQWERGKRYIYTIFVSGGAVSIIDLKVITDWYGEGVGEDDVNVSDQFN